MEALLIALVVVAAIAIGGASYYFKKKRMEGFEAFSRTYRFDHSPQGPPGLLAYGFPLFNRGDGRGAEHGIVGEWKGLPFKAADYWYYDVSTDSKGNRSKSYTHHSVAIVDIDAWLPDIAIYRENVLTVLADKLGMADIDFESEEFNRAFRVKAADRRFAFELVDPRMMNWLLSCNPDFGFEIHGKAILIYSHRLRPNELLGLIGSLKAFHDRVPRLVWTKYGEASASASELEA